MNKENIIKLIKNEQLSSDELAELYWLLNKDYYKERPVTIQEFISSDDFVHKKWPNVFPLWKQTLGELFPNPFVAPYNEVLISAAAGSGKALRNDQRVLTPDGWVEIGNTQIGQSICGTDGNVYKIEGVYPQGERETFKVYFSDNTEVICDGEHLWTVQSALDRDKASPSKGAKKQYSTLTTINMMKNLTYGKNKRLNYSVDYINPCVFTEKPIKIDPYLLGALIGDGSLSLRGQARFTNVEIDTVERIRQALNTLDCDLIQEKNLRNYRIVGNIRGNNLLLEALREYNLHGKCAWDKFIPKEYLYNSVEIRTKLLQGLIDTDGHVQSSEKRSGLVCNYFTTSSQLADDVQELVRSLGGRATITTRDRKKLYDINNPNGKLSRKSYTVNINFNNDKGIIPYASDKNIVKYHPERSQYIRKYITDIIPNGKAECTCIKVSAPNSLFITEGYNPTHNTVTATISIIYDIYKLGCLKNPCTFYGLTPDTMIIMAIFSATSSTAAVNWSEVTTGIAACPWIMDKLVDKRGFERKNGSITPVEIIPGIFIQTGSKFQHSMGKAIYDGLMDEAAFGGANMKDAQKSYNELSSRIKTRFATWGTKGNTPGHLFLISSPKEAGDFMQTRIEETKKADAKLTKVMQNIATWEADPRKDSDDKFTVFIGNENKEPCIYEPDEDVPIDDLDDLIYVPMRYYEEFKKDLLISIMNYGGITTTSDMALFKSPTALNDVFVLQNPFKKEVIELPFAKTDKTLMDYINLDYFKNIRHPENNRFIHIDAAFSTDTLDVYGLAASYALFTENTSFTGNIGEVSESDIFKRKDRMYLTDFVVGITAPKGQEVPLYKVQDFIEWLIKIGYPVAQVSADQFQSKQTLQNLQTKGIKTDNVSVDRSRDPYLFLRNLVYNKQVLIPKNDYLKDELRRLRDDGKKIDHPVNCFTGDTKIKLVDGRDVTINALLLEHSYKQNWVYTFNEETKRIEPKKIKRVFQSGVTKSLVKVTLDNGAIITCTPEHRFMLRDGSYEEIQNLTPGTSLMSLYTKVADKGLKGYRLYYEPVEDAWHYEHRRFCETDPTKNIVHHCNYNKLDNTPTNLKAVTAQEHRTIHNNSTMDYKKAGQSLSNYHRTHKDTEIPQGFKLGRRKVGKNHKIVSIESITQLVKVYDLEIEDNHNFALSAGVIVHNCHKDLSDSVAGSIWACANSTDIINQGRVAHKVLSNGITYTPEKAVSNEVLEFERIKQNMANIFRV